MITAAPVIIGGGLAGSLAAIMLARHGFEPCVFERDPAHDSAAAPAGRTINLALAARGIAALEAAGIGREIEPLLLPMAGRIIHGLDSEIRRLPYGQRPDERIYSVSRAALNRMLYRVAVDHHAIDYRFDCECTHYDAATGTARFNTASGDFGIRAPLLLAADGAGSTIRRSLAAAGLVGSDEVLLDHGYKELTFPPTAAGGHALAADGLHIWPRGGFMLIALPNLDGSFTATLFLPQHGPNGFESVAADPVAFFATQFPDTLALLPDLEAQFEANPVGILGTVHCHPWRHSLPGHDCLLLGDAAHAIVPFHGQGINAGFEDCRELDQLITTHGADWASVTALFEARRLPDTQAIARMALENYVEMRDGVRDPAFERRKALAFELERRTGGRFTPRYSLVMFHPEVGYAEAERRGEIQDGILRRATTGPEDDIELALQLIDEQL